MPSPSLMKRSLAELIGTYILVFLGTGSVVTAVLLLEGTETIASNPFNVGITMPAWLAIGLSFGIAVTAMIYAFGHISGTHINPAVSIALASTGRLPKKDLVGYIPAQLTGAVLASLSLVAILGSRATATGLGATAMFHGVSYTQAILCEGIATFILMIVIMGSAVDKRASPGFAGLAIGFTVAADIVAIGNITGSSLNPARTFGPYLAETLLGGANLWSQFPIYFFGPIAGAIAAAHLYDYISGPKKSK